MGTGSVIAHDFWPSPDEQSVDFVNSSTAVAVVPKTQNAAGA